MKVHLFDIENAVRPALLEEAHNLMRETREYDISRAENDFYHCVSRQPDYHVEIRLNDERLAIPKCHCAVFKRQKECRHAVTALLLLRDFIQRGRKARKRSDKETVDAVLQKLNITELRQFLSGYALSHAAFKSEFLSNYLYLTRKPDYHQLYQLAAPVDKFGQLQLNRNNIKTIRSISTTLLKRAQELLREQALAESLHILIAVLTQLHRCWSQAPAFQDQLLVELKMAYRHFESLCRLSMAPRLQLRAINVAIDICSKEKYQFPPGYKPLLQITENFILEEKTRQEAFEIITRKIEQQNSQWLRWASLLLHWGHIWNDTKRIDLVTPFIPQIITDLHQENQWDDILFAAQYVDITSLTENEQTSVLRILVKASRYSQRMDLHDRYAYELSLRHLDIDAWQSLYETDASNAVRVLKNIESFYPAGENENADEFLFTGWRVAEMDQAMLQRLQGHSDMGRLMYYDHFLMRRFHDEVIDLYARHIIEVKDAYGGLIARQKLNNIFSHLKAGGLQDMVTAQIKALENNKTDIMSSQENRIRGFVFDLDGVIVDTAVHHFAAWKKIMHQLGAEIEEEDDQHTRGAGRMESFEYLLNKYNIRLSEDEKVEWASRKNDAYIQSIQSISPADLLPGVTKFLEDSRQQGLLLALGSASKNAKPVLEKLKIADRFDAILDGNDTKASKPDPEIFLKAAAALGLDPSEVVVFEDAAKGVQAAIAAGSKVVGIGDKASLPMAHIVVPDLSYVTPTQIVDQLS